MAKKKAPVKKAAVKKPAKKTAAPKKTAAKKAAPKKTAAKAKKAVKKSAPVKKTVAAKTSTAKPAAPAPFKKASLQLMGLSPLGDRVLVQVQSGEKMTAGGLYIPDTASMTGNRTGKVLAAGQGGRNKKGLLRPLDTKAGDMVLFSEYAGDLLVIDGVEVKVLREADILGILEK